MNYLAEMKAFYDTLAINSLSSHDIALWYALMSIANRSCWKTEFTVALSVLAFYSGMNESTVKRSRNKLAQCGYITWRARNGNQSAVYHINSLAVHSELQTVPQSVPQTAPQTVPQSVPINKQKLNETETPPISPTGHFGDFATAYPKPVDNYMAAEREYIKALRDDVHLQENMLLVAARNYAESVEILGTDKRFIKNAENFIRDGTFVKYLDGNYVRPSRRKKESGSFNNFAQNNYDFAALEEELRSN